MNITKCVTFCMFLIYTSRLLVSRALNHVDFTKIQLISLLSLFLVCVCAICLCFEITSKLQDGNKATYPLLI